MAIRGIIAVLLALSLAIYADATVTMITPGGIQTTFDSMGAKFGPDLPDDGQEGSVVVAYPLNGCTQMLSANGTKDAVAVIQRGGCNFADKVYNAQLAGYIAAIVFDTIEEELIAMYMNGETLDIKIPSVFVSLDSGALLLAAPNGTIVNIYTEAAEFPPYLITFITITAAAIFIFSVFMFYRYRALVRRATLERNAIVRTVNLPSERYDAAPRGELTQCCICLEDFQPDGIISELPCKHSFHKTCVENWLNRSTRSTCPLCKQDPLAPPPVAKDCSSTERTPLLSP